MNILGPISWIIWIGAAWIVGTILLSVFWYRLRRREPRIRHRDETPV